MLKAIIFDCIKIKIMKIKKKAKMSKLSKMDLYCSKLSQDIVNNE